MSSSEPKTQPASAKKKRDALKKGNRPKSAMVGTSINALLWLVVGVMGWNVLVAVIWPIADGAMRWNVINMRDGITQAAILLAVSLIAIAVAAFGVALAAAALSVSLTHGQLAPATEALKPKFDKFNPASNAQQLFSLQQLYQLVRNVLYVASLGWVTWLVGKHYVGASLSLYRSSSNAIQYAAPNVIALAFIVGLGVTAAFGMADRTLEKLLWLKRLKMSKSEVKREYEEQNGNPHIKAERMSIARQAASAARDDALTYGNLVAYSGAEMKIVVMHTNESFKRPLVLWKETGDGAAALASELNGMGAEVVESASLTTDLFPKAQVGDFLNGAMADLMEQYRNV
jgi:type III secretion protein U